MGIATLARGILTTILAKFYYPATRWTTIPVEQECYGIYLGMQSFAYYLYAESFILETDHRNLICYIYRYTHNDIHIVIGGIQFKYGWSNQ